jgi:hypothetical protein
LIDLAFRATPIERLHVSCHASNGGSAAWAWRIHLLPGMSLSSAMSLTGGPGSA